VKVTGRQAAFVVEPEAGLELGLAAFPDADCGMVLDHSESLAPNLEPPCGALFLRIKNGNSARALHHHNGDRSQYHDACDCGNDDSATGTGHCHRQPGDCQTREGSSRRSHNQRRGDQDKGPCQDKPTHGKLPGMRDEYSNGKSGDQLQHFGVGLVVAVETGYAKVAARRGRQPKPLARRKRLSQRLSSNRRLSQSFGSLIPYPNRAASSIDNRDKIGQRVDLGVVGLYDHVVNDQTSSCQRAVVGNAVDLETSACCQLSSAVSDTYQAGTHQGKRQELRKPAARDIVADQIESEEERWTLETLYTDQRIVGEERRDDTAGKEAEDCDVNRRS